MPREQFYRATAVTSIPNERFENFDFILSGDLPPGETEVIEIFAPKNELAFLGGIKFAASRPNSIGATSGDHSFLIGRYSRTFLHGKGTFPFDTTIEFLGLKFLNSHLALDLFPSNDQAFILELKNQVFDEFNSLRIEYQNNTDVTITSDRIYRIHCMLRKIG